jgi:hypothetical protein
MSVAPAAKQLLKEIKAIYAEDDSEVLPERDGLGVQREIRIDKASASSMGADVLEALESDPRIAEMVRSNKGVRVVFVPTVQADYAHPFDLASVIKA